jgi:hypothetical protein
MKNAVAAATATTPKEHRFCGEQLDTVFWSS